MLQPQLAFPAPGSTSPPFPQTQSIYVPSNPIQQDQMRTYNPAQTINNQNARSYFNSQTNNPIAFNEAFSNQQASVNSLNGNVNIGGMSVNQSTLRQTRESKYKNKYSFKKNITTNSVGPLTSTFNNLESNANLNLNIKVSQQTINQLNQYRTIISKQQTVLTQIREITLNRWRRFDSNRTQTTESVRQMNQIIRIYNLTLINLNTAAKPLDFISEEIVKTNFSNGSINQAAYREVVNAPLPPFSQHYMIPAQPINHQIIKTPSVPVFVPTQNIVQNIPQPIKIEQKPLNPTFEPRPAVVPQQQNFVPPSRPEQIRYEPFQANFKEPKIPQPSQSSFKYQAYKPSYIDIEPTKNYQAYKPDSKPYPYAPDSKYIQNYYGGNALNINDGKDEGAFVYESAEVREFKRKIQQLEEQKTTLIDKIRAYEKSNNFENLNSQQTIQNCQQQISKLKAQIAELTVIYNNNSATKPNEVEVIELKKSISILQESIKQYEEQLIQAQNHIIYLQNSKNNEDPNSFEEVKYLRETIAKYTEHIEQMDIERRKFEELLQQKQTENHALAQEVHEANQYIQTLQQHIQSNPGEGNGVSYEIYQNLIVEYGKKEFQVIILLEEINRLNFASKDFQGHLERAEEYIITLQQAPGREGERLQALQAEHHSVLNTIGQYEQQLSTLSQQNKSLRIKITEVSNQKVEKVGNAVNQSYMNHQEYESLLEQIRKREEESMSLNQQINKLNEKYTETREHLQKAEQYIIHLQQTYASQSPVTALQRPDSERTKLFEQQAKEWQAKIKHLEGLLSQQNHERESFNKREAEFKNEYDDMEYRYKNALEELGKRYDQLLEERNSIAVTLSDTQHKINPGSVISHPEVQNLRQSLSTITAQLQESQGHLLTAEGYIEHNVKNWEEASSYKEKHDQLQSFVTIINNDLETTRKQNQLLATRLQSLEALVAEADKLKVENQQLTIVIREKDNVNVSTSLKQIDEVQEALTNYTRLYNESQQRVRQLQSEQHKNLVQIAQLEEYLTKAESFIIEQQNAQKTKERSVNELTQQLIKAEEHIQTLESEYNSALKLKDEYETISRAQYQKNTELHEALKKAQDYIYDLQSKNTLKK